MIYDEVKRVNERLKLIEDIVEEVLMRSLLEVEVSEQEIKDIESSIKEMKKEAMSR